MRIFSPTRQLTETESFRGIQCSLDPWCVDQGEGLNWADGASETWLVSPGTAGDADLSARLPDSLELGLSSLEENRPL